MSSIISTTFSVVPVTLMIFSYLLGDESLERWGSISCHYCRICSRKIHSHRIKLPLNTWQQKNYLLFVCRDWKAITEFAVQYLRLPLSHMLEFLINIKENADHLSLCNPFSRLNALTLILDKPIDRPELYLELEDFSYPWQTMLLLTVQAPNSLPSSDFPDELVSLIPSISTNLNMYLHEIDFSGLDYIVDDHIAVLLTTLNDNFGFNLSVLRLQRCSQLLDPLRIPSPLTGDMRHLAVPTHQDPVDASTDNASGQRQRRRRYPSKIYLDGCFEVNAEEIGEYFNAASSGR